MSKRKNTYPKPSDWCAFIINDERSLEKLNELLTDGWYLPHPMTTGIFFQTVFQIKPEALDILYEGLSSAFRVEGDHPLVMLLLKHGNGIEKQMALKIPVNADGYKDTKLLEEIVRKEAKEWEVGHVISITQTFGIAIIRLKKTGLSRW